MNCHVLTSILKSFVSIFFPLSFFLYYSDDVLSFQLIILLLSYCILTREIEKDNKKAFNLIASSPYQL